MTQQDRKRRVGPQRTWARVQPRPGSILGPCSPPPDMRSPRDRDHGRHSLHARSARYRAHCACHLPPPLLPPRPPDPPRSPLIITKAHAASILVSAPPRSNPAPTPAPALGRLISPKPNMTRLRRQRCGAQHARRTYCARSAVHLHRKRPRWLRRQRACVCQPIEQERLEGLLLRGGGGGGDTQRWRETEGGRE